MLSASEMAGFLRALLQAWLLLQGRGRAQCQPPGCSSPRPPEVETPRSGTCHGCSTSLVLEEEEG